MSDPCANCGFPKSEHHHDGACYGLCGEFSPRVDMSKSTSYPYLALSLRTGCDYGLLMHIGSCYSLVRQKVPVGKWPVYLQTAWLGTSSEKLPLVVEKEVMDLSAAFDRQRGM